MNKILVKASEYIPYVLSSEEKVSWWGCRNVGISDRSKTCSSEKNLQSFLVLLISFSILFHKVRS
jgi:hypothetical protein